MDLAEGQAVAHGGDARLLTIRDDVRGVKQDAVSQSAHRAPRVVGTQHVARKTGWWRRTDAGPLTAAPQRDHTAATVR